MELGGGPLQNAIGGAFNKETLSDQPDANQQIGNVFGSIQQSPANAKRDLKAFFAELSIPIVKGVEIQAAVRRDDYSGLEANIAGVQTSFEGSAKTSPKFAIKYQPSNSFAVEPRRRSFLAPSLKQLFAGQEQGAESVDCLNDPTNPDLCSVRQHDERQLSVQRDQRLQSEPEARDWQTYNIGFIFEPTPVLAVAVDFFPDQKEGRDQYAVSRGFGRRRERRPFAAGRGAGFCEQPERRRDTHRGCRCGLASTPRQPPLGTLCFKRDQYYTEQQQQEAPGAPFDEFNATFLFPALEEHAARQSGAWSMGLNLAVRTTSA